MCNVIIDRVDDSQFFAGISSNVAIAPQEILCLYFKVFIIIDRLRLIMYTSQQENGSANASPNNCRQRAKRRLKRRVYINKVLHKNLECLGLIDVIFRDLTMFGTLMAMISWDLLLDSSFMAVLMGVCVINIMFG